MVPSGESGECPVCGEGLSVLVSDEVWASFSSERASCYQGSWLADRDSKSTRGPGALTWAQQASRAGYGMRQGSRKEAKRLEPPWIDRKSSWGLNNLTGAFSQVTYGLLPRVEAAVKDPSWPGH